VKIARNTDEKFTKWSFVENVGEISGIKIAVRLCWQFSGTNTSI